MDARGYCERPSGNDVPGHASAGIDARESRARGLRGAARRPRAGGRGAAHHSQDLLGGVRPCERRVPRTNGVLPDAAHAQRDAAERRSSSEGAVAVRGARLLRRAAYRASRRRGAAQARRCVDDFQCVRRGGRRARSQGGGARSTRNLYQRPARSGSVEGLRHRTPVLGRPCVPQNIPGDQSQ